jgi:Glycosyl hydrolases family 43
MGRHRRSLTALIGFVLGSVVLTACFGTGFHAVGTPLTSTQMPPGLWRSLGGDGCTWARVAAGGVTTGRNIRTAGPQYMQVEPGDVGTAIGSCFPFWQQPGGFARPLVQPGSDFGDGDFLVGYEVNPGTYTASGGAGCTWAAVRGFHGRDSAGNNPDFIRGGSSGSAQIATGDYGFTSQGCGTWHFTSNAQPPPPTTTTKPTSPPPPPDPVFHAATENFPDPFVMRVDQKSKCGGDPAPCYYAYSTEAGFLGFINVPVIRSSDLVNWKWAGPPAPGQTAARKDAMPTLASWVTFGRNWAPSVMWNATANEYVMYYTAQSTSLGRQCIGVATSSAPDGPFVDSNSGPLTCPSNVGDSIDPSPFVDGSGNLWLQWADQNGLQSRQLAANGRSLTGGTVQLLAASQAWENGRVEAPSLMQTDDTGILLFYSGNVFNNAGYAVGAARCTAPNVLCTRIPPGSPILSGSNGPGGQSPFELVDDTWRIAYHAWSGGVGTGVRTLHIANLTFAGTSPNQTPSIG